MMANETVKRFRRLLIASGYVDVHITPKKCSNGRILYCSYVVTAYELLSRSSFEHTLSLTDMRRYLALSHVSLP